LKAAFWRGGWRLHSSGQDLLHHATFHIGEPVITPGVAVREALVVQAQEMQHRGVEVVEMDLPRDGAEAELVGLAMGIPDLDSAVGKPGGVAVGLVLAAVGVDRGGAREILAPRGAAELARPDDDGIL
jgi:hypothetical protein